MQKKYSFNARTGVKRPVTLSLYEAAELFGITPLSLACMLRDAKDAPEFFEVPRSVKNGPKTHHLRYYAKHEIIQWWRNKNETRSN